MVKRNYKGKIVTVKSRFEKSFADQGYLMKYEETNILSFLKNQFCLH
jgi:hypothetical protein